MKPKVVSGHPGKLTLSLNNNRPKSKFIVVKRKFVVGWRKRTLAKFKSEPVSAVKIQQEEQPMVNPEKEAAITASTRRMLVAKAPKFKVPSQLALNEHK